jgi:uncharacterized Zn-binding protein involved in type VI secretion
MPGPLLHFGATVQCSHGGQAIPMSPSPRVLLSGQPAVTILSSYSIAGCTFPPPPSGNGPCVTGMWLSGAARVLIGGLPAALQAGSSLCMPTGTPMLALHAQTRVVGT